MNCKLKEVANMHYNLMCQVKKEFAESKLETDINEPTWSILLKKGKMEFYNQIVLTVPTFIFCEEEYKAIAQVNFLEVCFDTWCEYGKGIPETIEIAAEYLAVELAD